MISNTSKILVAGSMCTQFQQDFLPSHPQWIMTIKELQTVVVIELGVHSKFSLSGWVPVSCFLFSRLKSFFMSHWLPFYSSFQNLIPPLFILQFPLYQHNQHETQTVRCCCCKYSAKSGRPHCPPASCPSIIWEEWGVNAVTILCTHFCNSITPDAQAQKGYMK